MKELFVKDLFLTGLALSPYLDASDPLEIAGLISIQLGCGNSQGCPPRSVKRRGSAQLAPGEKKILPAGDWFFYSLEEISSNPELGDPEQRKIRLDGISEQTFEGCGKFRCVAA